MSVSACQSCIHYGARSGYCFRYLSEAESVNTCSAKKDGESAEYDKLCESVWDAVYKMHKNCANPKFIYLSQSSFNTIAKGAPIRPTFFGLEVRIGCLPNGKQFAVTREELT